MTEKNIMKIYILGPVITNEYWGGVASFDEGLAEAFRDMGHDVIVISTQCGEIPLRKDLSIKLVKSHQINCLIKKDTPDVVIASLSYGRFLAQTMYAKKIYFLHGFFNFSSYGIVKTLLAVCYQKWMCLCADEVISNSWFTSAINYKFWKIKSDKVTWLGVNNEYCYQVAKMEKIRNANNGRILFAGRLVKGKMVDRIIQAFSMLEDKENRNELVIAGDGPLRKELEEIGKRKKCNVRFWGKVEHSKMYECYNTAEIFISLNETEPFGLTYIEALMAGCKIVCPKTGGQIEVLCNYPERVAFVDHNSEKEIAKGIEMMLNKQIEDVESRKLIDEFSYRRMIPIILQ